MLNVSPGVAFFFFGLSHILSLYSQMGESALHSKHVFHFYTSRSLCPKMMTDALLLGVNLSVSENNTRQPCFSSALMTEK